MKDSIGDFLVRLGLQTDKDSFDKGFKAVDQMTNSINRLVGTIRNAAPVIMAGLAGSFETAELKTAKAIGISTRALDAWKTAASMAGTNANGLAQSMANLEQKMQERKLGKIYTDISNNLGYLGLNYQNFAEMDAEQRMSAVIKSAQAMADQQEAALLVGNILGDAGKDYYYYLQLSGRTLEEQLAIGKSLVFTSDKSKKDAMIFNSELQGVISAGKSMSMLFGSEVGKQLTPIVRGVREWIGANNGLIQQGIVGFVDDIGTVFNKVVGNVVKIAPIVKEMIDGFGGLDQVIIKIGIGIAALQVGKLAMNLMSIFDSVSMVKLALMGLGGAALFGGIKGIMEDPEKMEHLKEAMKKIADVAKQLKDALKPFMERAFDPVITLLKDFADIVSKLVDQKWDELGTSIKNFLSDFKEGLGTVLVPKEENTIEKTVDKEKKSIGKVTEYIADGNIGAAVAEATATSIGAVVSYALGTNEYANTVNDLNEKIKAEKKAAGKHVWNSMTYNDLSPELQAEVDTAVGRGILPYNLNLDDSKVKHFSVKDGIISPSGTVTQVDPNDWVFAAKDLGKLASAFIPQAYSSNSSSSYIINQTFNVSGSHDIPSTIKQQAYAGTQAALLQNVNNSATRLQLMSNTY